MADNMITRDPGILAGKPVIRGTRISVEFVLGLLADGWSAEDVLQNYPQLSREQIAACLHYARDSSCHPSPERSEWGGAADRRGWDLSPRDVRA